MLESKKEARNKRGQGLSTTAIILIVLGVLVLVILLVGFSAGWDKIAFWVGGGDNVDSITQACAVACTTDSTYNFCTKKRDLKADGVELKDVTCFYLSEKQGTYGVDKCSGITSCDVVFANDEVDAKTKCTGEGKVVSYLLDDKLVSYTCTATDGTVDATGN